MTLVLPTAAVAQSTDERTIFEHDTLVCPSAEDNSSWRSTSKVVRRNCLVTILVEWNGAGTFDPEALPASRSQVKISFEYSVDVRALRTGKVEAGELDFSCKTGPVGSVVIQPAQLLSKRVAVELDGRPVSEEELAARRQQPRPPPLAEVPLYGDERTRAVIPLDKPGAARIIHALTSLGKSDCLPQAQEVIAPQVLTSPDPSAGPARANALMLEALELRDETIADAVPMTGLGFYKGRARITHAIRYRAKLEGALQAAAEALRAGVAPRDLDVVRQAVHYLSSRGLPHRIKVALFDADSQVLETDENMAKIQALKRQLP